MLLFLCQFANCPLYDRWEAIGCIVNGSSGIALMVTQTQLETIIESLQHLTDVLNAARPTTGVTDSPKDPSYPYAVGYTTSGINGIIFDLQSIIKYSVPVA